MSATDPVAPTVSGGTPSGDQTRPTPLRDQTRPTPPRGTIELFIRWSSSVLVLGVGIALLTVPGVAESGVDSITDSAPTDSTANRAFDADLRWVRLSSGAGLILLLVVREMFVWFGTRRP